MKKSLAVALIALIASSGGSAAAELRDTEVHLFERFKGLTLEFDVKNWPKDAHGVTLSIDPPETLKTKERLVNTLSLEFGKSVPQVNLQEVVEEIIDGRYGYEISVGTQKQVKKDEEFNNGREKESEFDLISYSVSGHFIVAKGEIVVFDQFEEKGSEKTVTNDDNINDGDK